MMLRELQGSPKQIAWALKIRVDRLNYWSKSDPIIFRRVEPELNSETSAAWWITYREKDLSEVLKYIQGGGLSAVKAVMKPKSSPLPSIPNKKSHVATGDDGVTRYVGELMDAVTGAVAVNPDCPF